LAKVERTDQAEQDVIGSNRQKCCFDANPPFSIPQFRTYAIQWKLETKKKASLRFRITAYREKPFFARGKT
jgi:hypothetical protein